MKKNAKMSEIQSLNENLNTELYLNELEQRLETDPMLLGNPVDASLELTSDSECFSLICFTCGEF